jgi:U1 small nuclear ribonucleoprotein
MPPRYSEEIAQLFRPRPKLRFIAPDPMPEMPDYSPLSTFLPLLPDPSAEMPPPADPILSVQDRHVRRRNQRIAANELRVAAQRARYDPSSNPNATSDPYNTLFLSGLSPSVTEGDIRYELTPFGPIRSVRFVFDVVTGERKDDCFVEYEREESFTSAMRQGTRLYFGNRRVIVDCERGRTVPGWLPRRLGGGLGGAARRFTPKLEVLEQLNCKKRKRTGYKCGVRYRGTLAEVQRRRDEKFGFVRQRGRLRRERPRPE